MEHELNVIFDCLIPIGTCFVLSVVYIASLYVWNSQHDRNHPTTIKRRFLSVFIMMIVSPMFSYLAINKSILEKTSLFVILGLKLTGIFQAFILPLLLTKILFLGPIYMQYLNGTLKHYSELTYWTTNMKNLIWLRNHVVAPLSEEFTFRSCMLPLLLQYFKPLTAIYIAPLFFGVAHFHHMIERVRYGMEFKIAFLISCFHFTYTTIFGAYSAYIFYRTGHFASTFIVHSFCNHMGVPDIQELLAYKGQQRYIIVTLFFVGLILWTYLLNPLTNPKWYHNETFWYTV